MKFSILASGSSGNATAVCYGSTAILVDCGVSTKALKARAQQIGFELSKLDAILVTHEHGDHANGVAVLARRYEIPVYTTHGTALAAGLDRAPGISVIEISPHEEFTIGELAIKPAPVPHDAREPCQFVIESAAMRLGILTDIGRTTRHVEQHFADCDALVLEFNHDPEMLAQCAYPASLKARVAGPFGHFSNEQARTLLRAIVSSRLQHVVAAHLSENSNRPALVGEILLGELAETATRWSIAERGEPTGWFDLATPPEGR